MGRELDEREYSADDFEQFNRRIHDQVDILKEVITRPKFGKEKTCIGAELEVYLMDEQGDVSPVNLQLLKMLKDEQFQSELNKFNLEINLSPVKAKGKPFTQIATEMCEKFDYLWSVAEKIKTRPLAVGILPTLQEKHLTNEYMTDLGRYKILARELLKQRGAPFHIKIDEGEEAVDFLTTELCVEGANTSFQVHLMVEPERFSNTFNTAQLTLPMALGVSANSGVLLGKCLWDETRVVLFKQSADSRMPDASGWRQPSRVTFGHGWVRKSAWELFSETVNLYQPIFPELFSEKSKTKLPELPELNLHMGSTWPWNRAVYSHHGNGHLRVEFRALPAGPTALDMAANAAFSIGMAVGLEEKIDEYMSRIPFQFAEYNFYRAAKLGLDATILWPQNYQNKPVEVPIKNIIDDMLQVASDGLSKLDVDRDEKDKYLTIIQRRLATGVTGARWTKQTLRCLRKSMSNEKACAKLLDMYFENQMEGRPVSEWDCCWK
ncbi:hypothetical protein [Aliikangiella coralliicola]|uniref:Glutamate--cysteine ligase n=1 Tax=Aliikangiella coralliicola TaxID=2592383 RepID=A0A545U7D9_9GAMM|nr:hypothetical protein [Aliikangiella coralliicola]TQV85323.1 hypothetical protein FLL46_19345 [Aliikangiella coralliicola]